MNENYVYIHPVGHWRLVITSRCYKMDCSLSSNHLLCGAHLLFAEVRSAEGENAKRFAQFLRLCCKTFVPRLPDLQLGGV
jgi:hypothetical protein